MSDEEYTKLREHSDHIAFRNEILDLVQDAIRSERENPVLIVGDATGTHWRIDAKRAGEMIKELDELHNAPYRGDPIKLILTCPMCSARHIDEGEFATKVHHTHSCQKCGLTWRPAVQPTVGVQFLPGFKNKD